MSCAQTKIKSQGYANEVGESFRASVSPNVVKASYVVSFGYVLLDTIDKTIKCYKKESLAITSEQTKESPIVKASKTGADCLIWQTFASVLIPGLFEIILNQVKILLIK